MTRGEVLTRGERRGRRVARGRRRRDGGGGGGRRGAGAARAHRLMMPLSSKCSANTYDRYLKDDRQGRRAARSSRDGYGSRCGQSPSRVLGTAQRGRFIERGEGTGPRVQGPDHTRKGRRGLALCRSSRMHLTLGTQRTLGAVKVRRLECFLSCAGCFPAVKRKDGLQPMGS